jgi:hypothetical protein
MSDLPPYPDEPIQEKDIQQFTVLCTQKEANYKKYSDKNSRRDIWVEVGWGL